MNKSHANEPQPTDCYLLRVERLHAGDIILTKSPGQAGSELIRAVTFSDYSHAILVLNVDPPYGIESSDYGVVKFRLDRFAVREPQNIAVRRVRSRHFENVDVQTVVSFCDGDVRHDSPRFGRRPREVGASG
jgi:hypothetical protein